MTKIILLCAAGMSTSALVRKMQDAAKADNYECEISAHPVADASNYADADIILLGPQVRYRLKEVQGQLPNNKVEVIDMKDYGMMNGNVPFYRLVRMLYSEIRRVAAAEGVRLDAGDEEARLGELGVLLDRMFALVKQTRADTDGNGAGDDN